MVFFSDKNGSTYNVDNPQAFLSQRSIDRRTQQGIAVVEQDLPVVQSYIDAVRSIEGVRVLFRTKWMNGVLVQCDQSLTGTISALPFVTSIEYVAPGPSPGTGRVGFTKNNLEVNDVQQTTDVQLSMIGVDQMHAEGYHGEGILIAVLDAGFTGADQAPQFQHVFQEGRFSNASYNFVYSEANVFGYNSHGTLVWSVMAAYDAQNFIGGAYKASYVLFLTEDARANQEYRVEEYNWLFAAERADSVGADVINSSLGYNTFVDPQMDYLKSELDGETAVITRAANIAFSKGMIVVTSAGNEGANAWGLITTPADSRNVMSIGNVMANGTKSATSSTGPTADGRIKPDIVALGSNVAIVKTDGTYGTASGTSVAAPLITSLVAGIKQVFPELNARKIMDTIIHTASQANQPDNLLGYGIPNYSSIFNVTSTEDPTYYRAEIYPNPGNGIFVVKARGIESITCRSATGIAADCHVTYDTENKWIVSLNGSPQGLYIITIKAGNQIKSHKVLKIE